LIPSPAIFINANPASFNIGHASTNP
jgi:hypothetical protein